MGGLQVIRAVFFDLYETLISEFDPDWKQRAPVGAELGLNPEAFREQWRARRRERHVGAYPDYAAVLRDICQVMGKPIDEDLIQQLQERRLAAKAAPFCRIGDDIVCMIRGLRERGVKLGLISNCEHEEVAAWPSCSLAPYFDDAVFSFDVACVKPEREIYEIACRRMGVVADESIFVGDGGSNELGGATRAGMVPVRAAWFSRQWAKRSGSELYNAEDAAYPRVGRPAELLTALQPYLDGGQ